MPKKLMVDPPEGWKHGFPKFVDEATGHEINDMTIDELADWLMGEGYPSNLADKFAGWCRFMWIEDRDER